MKYERALRVARGLTVNALDVLAEREGAMPNNDAGHAVENAMRHLIAAKQALDLYLDKGTKL